MSIEKTPSVPRFGAGSGTGGPAELTPEDQERARGLKKMRTLALSLLILATLIFLSTHLFTDLSGVWGFVSRASEAAMIGAIADWFAVTALFRHPLGPADSAHRDHPAQEGHTRCESVCLRCREFPPRRGGFDEDPIR